MKNKFFDTIKNGCSIFTIITLVSYTIGMILSTAEKTYIPKLKTIYLYLLVSILLAFTNRILYNKKTNIALRLFIHFLISCILFFCIAAIGGGLSNSGFATIIMMFLFVVVYMVFALIFLAINKNNANKINSEQKYSTLFK